jgi:hypothetical protein
MQNARISGHFQSPLTLSLKPHVPIAQLKAVIFVFIMMLFHDEFCDKTASKLDVCL